MVPWLLMSCPSDKGNEQQSQDLNSHKPVLFLLLSHLQCESVSNTFPPQVIYVYEPVLNDAVWFSSLPPVITPVLPIYFITRFISWLIYFFPFLYLNDGGTGGHFLDSELWQPYPYLKKSLVLHLSHLAWHQSWKRLPMTRWTFSVCKLYNSTNDFISV